LFFTPPAWIDSFRSMGEAISEVETSLEISGGVDRFSVGEELRIVHEELLVTAIDTEAGTIEVTRGYNDTPAVPHDEGAEIYRADEVTLTEFFTSTQWQPQLGNFGILPLLNATLMTSFVAMLVAIPLGLFTAIFLSEYATPGLRSVLKPLLELLAGVPTVVYGYFALTFMTPLLRSLLGIETVEIYNTASAGVVVGIMIIPTIASVSEDALRAVPSALREASYGLGATRLETVIKVVVPAALSGIVASFILGVSRAVGETMIVSLAAGAGPNFTLNPFKGAETMTGHIVRISGGDISYNSIDYNSLFAIGLLLFLMTLALNIFSQIMTGRFREVYE
jgi:phosphate transport system permease protein